MADPIEALRTPPPGKSQPIQTISADQGPTFDDAAVRAAIVQAEANNQDPMTIQTNELSQGSVPKVPEVPTKFLKPDGAVDVDKLQASTKALEDGIQKKEEAIQKVQLTVEELVRQNQELERQFRSMPNAEKLTASLPPVQAPTETPPANFEQIVLQDFQRDPLGTMLRLNEIQMEKKLSPFKEREKIEATRSNLQALADKDPRILQPDVFAAIKAKLQSNPELWNLKNPHKAAYLEVKDEMRLGEPNGAQAQPSRMPSPVLGGGTPPSAPSSSVQINPQDILSNLHKLDLRNKEQEALGDEAIRRQLQGSRG